MRSDGLSPAIFCSSQLKYEIHILCNSVTANKLVALEVIPGIVHEGETNDVKIQVYMAAVSLQRAFSFAVPYCTFYWVPNSSVWCRIKVWFTKSEKLSSFAFTCNRQRRSTYTINGSKQVQVDEYLVAIHVSHLLFPVDQLCELQCVTSP